MTTTNPSDATTPVAFEIEVTLASPVCLSSGMPAGNVTRTLNYIPGSAVRGMLAQFYLDKVGNADERFHRLFTSGNVTYGNLYLSRGRGSAPTPLSAHSCKYEPGFLADQADDERHGVIDLLVATYAQMRVGRNNGSPMRVEECPSCGAQLERFTGFYESTDGGRQAVPVERLRRLITRSATDDRLQTAEQGLLYSIEVLDPTAFRGDLPASGFVYCATPEVSEELRQHLLRPSFEETRLAFFVGSARTRGCGEVVSAGRPLRPFELSTQLPPLSDRLDAFNRAVHEVGGDESRNYFAITLQSDAVVQDEFFRFLGTMPAEMLAWEAGFERGALELIGSFTESHQVSGWNTAMRTPKAKVSAIRMGSAFLYSARGVHEQHLVEMLTGLEARGIGSRRAEGFGRVKVCDPFHVEARKDYV